MNFKTLKPLADRRWVLIKILIIKIYLLLIDI